MSAFFAPPNPEISRLWWLWLPLAALIAQLGVEFTLAYGTLSFMHGENGTHESLQVVIVVAGFCVALFTLVQYRPFITPVLKAWLALAALCCFYVAGEEISWGQHILKWTTPQYWSQINDQAETNLHNTSSWLDQKPRLILELGVLAGGIIVPLLQRYKPGLLPQMLAPLYPPAWILPLALMIFTITIADKIGDIFGAHIFYRGSEVEELYLYYFVLIYLVFLRRRIGCAARDTITPVSEG